MTEPPPVAGTVSGWRSLLLLCAALCCAWLQIKKAA